MICFVFEFILQTAYNMDACALTSIQLSLCFIDMIYFTAYIEATLASVQCVGAHFEMDMDFASPQRFQTCSKVNCAIPFFSVLLMVMESERI